MNRENIKNIKTAEDTENMSNIGNSSNTGSAKNTKNIESIETVKNIEDTENTENIENTEKNEIKPKLYLCATPIGNLGDITLRVIETLKNVDCIYCEDTRNTLKLLNYFGIKKPTASCHEHNEMQRAEEIARRVSGGEAVAFVSDAGMPAVSDPGSRLIKHFIEKELSFEILPGANAAITAWALSGLPTDSMYFCGFLPRNGKTREDAVEKLKYISATAVIYESPLRVGKTLLELYEKLGDRPCALVRELTKLYEQVIRGTLLGLAEKYAEEPPKGECVIVIGGAPNEKRVDKEKIRKFILSLTEEGIGVKNIAKMTSEIFDIPKNDAYKLACELKRSHLSGEKK